MNFIYVSYICYLCPPVPTKIKSGGTCPSVPHGVGAYATATHCLLLWHWNPDWLYLNFWYRLTRVVPGKRPLNGCTCHGFVFQSDWFLMKKRSTYHIQLYNSNVKIHVVCRFARIRCTWCHIPMTRTTSPMLSQLYHFQLYTNFV